MNAKPRIIRKVTKMGRDGRPKVVRDYYLGITVERVKASAPRRCADPGCPWPIDRGYFYCKVTDPYDFARGVRVRGMSISTKDYHARCLPPKLIPVRRFFARSWPRLRVNTGSSVTP